MVAWSQVLGPNIMMAKECEGIECSLHCRQEVEKKIGKGPGQETPMYLPTVIYFFQLKEAHLNVSRASQNSATRCQSSPQHLGLLERDFIFKL
jgi:hypothetical protein